jgi:hypothetical protein
MKIEKLKKLLRLSESPNEHEAALAMERAQALAMELGIELASVDATEQRAAIEKEEMDVRKSTARNFAMRVIVNHFPVGVASNRAAVWFYGARENIEFAQFLLPFLIRQFRALWRERKKAFPHLRREASYYEGVLYGIQRRLMAAEEANSKWALVLATQKTRIDEAMADLPKSKARGTSLSPTELLCGLSDAKKVNLNRPLENRTECLALGI